MCDPVSLTLALTVGMAAMTAHGQMQAADAAADAAEAQGQAIATQAGQEQDAANAQAERVRAAAKRQKAEATAAFSASGVSVDAGTPLKINEEITRGGSLDALNTIISAGRQGEASITEAAGLGAKAAATRKAGQIQAASTLMQSGAQAATASGWRSSGPGFSGGQKPAPISDLSVRRPA